MVGTDLFSEVFDFPDPYAEQRYAALVGVDDVKERLVSEAILLLDHGAVSNWSNQHHGSLIRAAQELTSRPPLIILAGDVGTGKTELAETFVSQVTRQMNVNGSLYALSLSARGQGAVGQMSSLIGRAFSTVADESKTGYRDGKSTKISVLLVDEGDALAQSRESSQMHHEDRAGVNALIKGIDGLRKHNLPVLVILCTNRISAVDPAVRRRAAFTVELKRPNDQQRRALFVELLKDVRLTEQEVEQLVLQTGPTEDRSYGYTYSDIRQRLVPEGVILGVSRNVPLSLDVMLEAIKRVPATRPFNEGGTSNE